MAQPGSEEQTMKRTDEDRNERGNLCWFQSKPCSPMPAVRALDDDETSWVSPASDVPNAWPGLISLSFRLECAYKTLARDILSPSVMSSFTTHQWTAVWHSRTTVLELDCSHNTPTAREARDPRKNPGNSDFTRPNFIPHQQTTVPHVCDNRKGHKQLHRTTTALMARPLNSYTLP